MNPKFLIGVVLFILGIIIGLLFANLTSEDEEDTLENSLPQSLSLLYSGQVKSISYDDIGKNPPVTITLKNGTQIKTSSKISKYIEFCGNNCVNISITGP